MWVYYILPIMGGGNGAGAIPMSQIYQTATGQSADTFYAKAIATLTFANTLCIVVAALLNKLGMIFPKLTGDGSHIMRSESSSDVKDKEKAEDYKPTMIKTVNGVTLRMDLDQMRYFVTVAECRSITKAAQQLYISQPSLSRSITAVEEEAGTLLLDRTTRPLSLTFAGQRYHETAKKILELSTDLTRQLRDINDCASGQITIGCSSQWAAYTLPAVLPKFKARYPGVEIRTCEQDSAYLEDALLKGKVDLVVFPDRTTLESNDLIDTTVLGQEEFLLACGDGVLSREQCLDGYSNTVDFAKLREYPFVLLRQGHGSRRKCDRIFHSYGFEPKIAFECDSNALVLRVAAAKIGLAMVPQRIVEMHRGCVNVNTYHISNPPVMWNVLAASCMTARKAFEICSICPDSILQPADSGRFGSKYSIFEWISQRKPYFTLVLPTATIKVQKESEPSKRLEADKNFRRYLLWQLPHYRNSRSKSHRTSWQS